MMEFQEVSCSRCEEVVAYIPNNASTNTKLALSVAEITCWRCTQRSKKTTKQVVELPKRTPPDGPRAA